MLFLSNSQIPKCMNPLPLRTIALLCLATLAGTFGCSTSPPQPPLSRDAGKGLRTIAIVRPVVPPQLHYVNARGLQFASAFGLLGEMVGFPILGAEANRRSAELAARIADTAPYQDSVPAVLERRLSSIGLRTRIVESPARPPGNIVPLDTRPAAAGETELDVAFSTFGFLKEPGKAAMYPCILATVQLTGSDRRAPLFNEVMLYGPPVQTFGCITFTAPSNHLFSSFEDLLARPETAREGLEAGIAALADYVGRSLAADRAHLQVRRVPHFGATDVLLYLEVDGAPAGPLTEKAGLTVPITPGKHTVRAYAKPNLLLLGTRETLSTESTLDVLPGEDIYLLVDLVAKAFQKPMVELRRVTREESDSAFSKPAKSPNPRKP